MNAIKEKMNDTQHSPLDNSERRVLQEPEKRHTAEKKEKPKNPSMDRGARTVIPSARKISASLSK
jgi:hypothetical protein